MGLQNQARELARYCKAKAHSNHAMFLKASTPLVMPLSSFVLILPLPSLRSLVV